MHSAVPFRALNRPAPDTSVTKRTDGSYLMQSNIAIGEYETNISKLWHDAAIEMPDRPFLVQCSPEETWAELTYKEAKEKADQISNWLLKNGYSEKTSILILSTNSFSHALLAMGALQIGVPIVPVSPSFSLMTKDFEKLKYAADLVEPKMVFAEDAAMFGKAIDILNEGSRDIFTAKGVFEGTGRPFEDLLDEDIDLEAIEEARTKVHADTLAKILFTSGSTGMPKAVPNTMKMICSGQKMLELISEPRDPINDPLVFLDWLPWHHTYGGNVNFFSVMRVAGTMYMDDGKPVPGLFERTIENIKRVKPTRFSSVPTAFSFLLDRMENDEEFANAFFSRVKICQYGGAALSQELFERMQVQAIKYTGLRMPFGTGWGATETTAVGTAVYWNEEKVGLLGVPYSGIDVKLVPVAGKYEIRVKGPAILEGYYKRPDLTKEYFDEEGFYCIRDAVKFIDPEDPSHGLTFAGRVSEDFKLSNGTWVEVGSLRLNLIDALDPYVRDIVIAGHDMEDIGILLVPSEPAMKEIMANGFKAQIVLDAIADTTYLQNIKEKLESYNEKNKGKSRRVGHVLAMGYPLSPDKNEITDKQYINQSAVLENRAQLVERLFNSTDSDDVLHF
ncbi:AMP-binding protein [Sneathiella sp. P13V-1]|uniref:AMP-binding protein n=1 Tax=Sneathiella sp. P13V-1 TaxID=2697366 RepID=UPI00187BB2E5|nr:AMP-binding protein [Sneathiella sp. P13V-1]MBE7637300.1 AMP-binding protein [Sneathiella sp. P13V-1]